MKAPKDVGRDFDEYARQWESERYRMETGGDDSGLLVDEDDKSGVCLPGDEWGDRAKLVDLYSKLLPRFLPGSDSVNILEIGAGGGRSTQSVVDVLGTRIVEYHVVDVSAEFIKVLQARIDREIQVHVISDVDLSDLPLNHFDLCLAQSSWSHISIYDQYRYLRDLRTVLKVKAPLIVHGQFLLGSGDDWTWNRFRRRVYQIEHGIEGVFHEFTGLAALAEQLLRLGYDIELIHTKGFIARSGGSDPSASRQELGAPPTFPYLSSLNAYAAGRAPGQVRLA